MDWAAIMRWPSCWLAVWGDPAVSGSAAEPQVGEVYAVRKAQFLRPCLDAPLLFLMLVPAAGSSGLASFAI